MTGSYRTAWPLRLALLILAASLLAHSPAQAQNYAAAKSMRKGGTIGDVLVNPAVADSGKPAALTLDLSKSNISPRSRLELSVAPEKVSPDEAYIVVVSPQGKPDKQLGSFSFYPPPRAGEVRKFLVNVPQLAVDNASQGRTILSVELVPVNDKDKFATSSLRVIGARIVN